MSKNDIFHFLAVIGLVVIALGTGFYFGSKTAKKPDSSMTASKEQIETIAQNVEQIKIVEKEVPEVYFFKIDEIRQCPKDYIIKAKFGTDAPVFYTTANKFYNRVKPDLCIASKETALQKGFVEKM